MGSRMYQINSSLSLRTEGLSVPESCGSFILVVSVHGVILREPRKQIKACWSWTLTRLLRCISEVATIIDWRGVSDGCGSQCPWW